MNPRKITMLFGCLALIPVFGEESQNCLLEQSNDEIAYPSQEKLSSYDCTLKFDSSENLNEVTVVYPIEESDCKTPFESNK